MRRAVQPWSPVRCWVSLGATLVLAVPSHKGYDCVEIVGQPVPSTTQEHLCPRHQPAPSEMSSGTRRGVEFIGGLLSGSLALLSDAAHMAADVLGLGLALAAIQLGQQARSVQ